MSILVICKNLSIFPDGVVARRFIGAKPYEGCSVQKLPMDLLDPSNYGKNLSVQNGCLFDGLFIDPHLSGVFEWVVEDANLGPGKCGERHLGRMTDYKPSNVSSVKKQVCRGVADNDTTFRLMRDCDMQKL